uniref:Uncharacterized protein n=1 Tax=Acrobeloides nanus TaxID=290746 RepID=A0A914E477_9BILA
MAGSPKNVVKNEKITWAPRKRVFFAQETSEPSTPKKPPTKKMRKTLPPMKLCQLESELSKIELEACRRRLSFA